MTGDHGNGQEGETLTIVVRVDTSAGGYTEHPILERLRSVEQAMRRDGLASRQQLHQAGVAYAATHLAGPGQTVAHAALSAAAIALAIFATDHLRPHVDHRVTSAAVRTAVALVVLADETTAAALIGDAAPGS